MDNLYLNKIAAIDLNPPHKLSSLLVDLATVVRRCHCQRRRSQQQGRHVYADVTAFEEAK